MPQALLICLSLVIMSVLQPTLMPAMIILSVQLTVYWLMDTALSHRVVPAGSLRGDESTGFPRVPHHGGSIPLTPRGSNSILVPLHAMGCAGAGETLCSSQRAAVHRVRIISILPQTFPCPVCRGRFCIPMAMCMLMKCAVTSPAFRDIYV